MKAVISVQGLAELISAGKSPLIVDVREAHELVSLPFNGAETVHIPLGQLGIRMNEIPKGQAVYMLCRSGGRSEMAQDMLLKAGYKDVFNITGGTLAWVELDKVRSAIEVVACPPPLEEIDEPAFQVDSPAFRELRALGVPFSIVKHPDGVRSAAELAEYLKVSVAQIPKTLLLEVKGFGHVVCILSSDRRVKFEAISRAFGGGNASMASRDDIVRVTGFQLGTVSPYGLPSGLPIIIDEALLDVPQVYVGCGVSGYDVAIGVESLLRSLRPQILACSA